VKAPREESVLSAWLETKQTHWESRPSGSDKSIVSVTPCEGKNGDRPPDPKLPIALTRNGHRLCW
jgi:hypothetical protein